MKVLYIDIETTGLDCEKHQILELGALYDDGGPIDSLRRLSVLINHDTICGQPYALHLNRDLLKRIANGEGVHIANAVFVFHAWLCSLNESNDTFNVGGKNVAGFDMQFLLQWPGFQRIGSVVTLHRDNRLVKFRQRTIDPAILYYQDGDEKTPDLQTCAQRAGFEDVVSHRAIDDCILTCKLVRHKLG